MRFAFGKHLRYTHCENLVGMTAEENIASKSDSSKKLALADWELVVVNVLKGTAFFA